MKLKDIITIDPETLGGTPVFTGTRVPVWSLFVHLEKGVSLEEFLDDFPTVKHEYAVALLEIVQQTFSSEKTSVSYMKVLLDENVPRKNPLHFNSRASSSPL